MDTPKTAPFSDAASNMPPFPAPPPLSLPDTLANPERLDALMATELLNTPPEENFDRLTRLATRIFKTPVSLVTLVDSNRQFFKSSCGLPESWATAQETPLTHSFCQHVVASAAPLSVSDALVDPRLRSNLAVRDLGATAYLGVPLTSPDGKHVLGSFCVIDTVPRAWTPEDIELLTDLSQSVMAEIALRSQMRAHSEAEAKLKRAVRGSRDGLWEWNFKTDVLFLSPQSKAMLGYFDHEIANTPHGWREHLIEDDYEAITAAIQQFVNGRGGPVSGAATPSTVTATAPEPGECANRFELEYRMRHKNGSVRWIHSRAVGYLGETGRLVLLSGSHTDITDRKRTELALQSQTQSLKTQAQTLKTQAMELEKARDVALSSARTKSQFLANMSHEIRTPMNGVLGMAGLLAETPLLPQQQEYLHTIRSSSEALLAIINDILDLSKIESGNLLLDDAPFVLRTLVEGVADLLMPKVLEKRLELACSVAPSLPPVFRGDAGRLRQILLNIGSNAAKFTDSGHIEIAVSAAPDTAPGSGDTPRLRFVVHDTGIGIPRERQDAIFHSFTQADVSTTRKYGGTGLGLTISRQLAGLMGGNISVVSTVGVGSTLTADIPCRVETDSAVATAAIAAQVVNSLSTADKKARIVSLLVGKRVLVVDDIAANRQILREQFEAWGARVEEAEDGIQGVRLLHERGGTAGTAFALVMLDMHMPGMDGKTTAHRIKSDLRFRDLPLILLSSGAAVRDFERGGAAANDFRAVLSKPVRQNDLLGGVLSALDRGNRGTDSVAPPPDDAPASNAALSIDPSAGDNENALLAGARILLAEDNPVNLKVALALLAKWGCHAPLAVENGLLALETIVATAGTPDAFDLVLMDVQMPEMDGLTATARIRESEEARRLPAIPIIALTAHAMTGDRDRCLASGMSDYVAKPVRPDALKTALQKWLPRTRVRLSSSAVGDTDKAGLPPQPFSLNTARLRESCGNDVEVMREVVADYRESVPLLFARIAAAIAGGDKNAAQSAAHMLKGGSGTVGAEVLAGWCDRIEATVGSGATTQARRDLESAQAEWGRVEAAFATDL